MTEPFILAPRYRLDDESLWLEGIDPARNYWIKVNGDPRVKVMIPGLMVSSLSEWKENILKFRALKPQEFLKIDRLVNGCTIHCISSNCYAIEIDNDSTWHLFDAESLESLLMTSHPDWIPSPKDIELGRELLARSWQQAVYV